MNLTNIFAGLIILLIGLLFDILLLVFNKKIKSPWIVFGTTLLCDIIAFLLWWYVPEEFMPHCLGCLAENTGYIFDKNNLKTHTIFINSVIGIVLLCSKYKMKKGWINKILQVLSILVICSIIILSFTISYA
jgi:magnesium-transporting ATPase (P-type)